MITVNSPIETNEALGVLLVNLGSPDAPTAKAVKRYLAEFLWDPRVVDIPRLPWWFILHVGILNIRPRHVAHNYKKVWTDDGSPLVAITRGQAQAVGKQLKSRLHTKVYVDFAMRYGKPSISSALESLRDQGAERLLVVPMYPQYSTTTSASVMDAVGGVLREWRWLPDLRYVNQYFDNNDYIEALAASVRDYWNAQARSQILLFSFHGIPRRFCDNGDPYFKHCQATARLVSESLQLEPSQWQLVFQSRFGREEWLGPACDKVLQALPGNGVKSVDILCPGFSADCLETLEEIDMQNRELFLHAGGESYHYIPALNMSEPHINALCNIIEKHAA